MPSVRLQHSPLAGGPAQIHYRQVGAPRQDNRPLVFLHGGWGYEIYPLSDRQTSLPGVQVIIPDRSGYGRSTKPAIFNADFHRLAAAETLAFLNALDIRQCLFWGHSDGAVIAAWLGLTAPERCHGLILEALHYLRVKPHSIDFFTALAEDPETIGERAMSILSSDHGEDHWRNAIRGDCRAWIEIAGTPPQHAKTARAGDPGAPPGATDPATPDLYGGRLNEIRVPVALVHGECDPRTEPGELDQIKRELPSAQVHIIRGAEHSPHSSRNSQDEVARVVRQTVAGWL